MAKTGNKRGKEELNKKEIEDLKAEIPENSEDKDLIISELKKEIEDLKAEIKELELSKKSYHERKLIAEIDVFKALKIYELSDDFLETLKEKKVFNTDKGIIQCKPLNLIEGRILSSYRDLYELAVRLCNFYKDDEDFQTLDNFKSNIENYKKKNKN